MNNKKETIVITQGHLYLFWATGVYYIREMVEKYNVILVVPDEYKEDPKFADICNKIGVLEIYYFSDSEYFSKYKNNKHFKINNITRHFQYSKLAKKIIKKYKPTCLLQHDYIGIENMYFFHWAKKLAPSCKRLVILSSQPSNEKTLIGFAEFKRYNAQALAKKTGVPAKILLPLQYSFRFIQSLFRNKIIPTLALMELPYFPLSAFNNIDIVPKKELFHCFLLYEAIEKKFYDSLFENKYEVKIIQSPIVDSYGLNKTLYNVAVGKNIIIFFSLTGLKGVQEDTEDIKRWNEAILLLKEKFPQYKIMVKFHPNCSKNKSEWMKDEITKTCDTIEFVEPQKSASELILMSEIVIGDASSTLIWANYIGDKAVISIDMGNSINSGDMKRYNGIKSIDCVSNIGDIALLELQRVGDNKLKSTQQNLLSLGGFIKQITSQAT